MAQDTQQGRTPALIDAALLAVIVGLSAAPYLGGLGFYSDDWAFLSSLVHHQGEGFFRLFGQVAVEQETGPRPGQTLYLITLFRLFGLHPLGYHLANLAVLAGMGGACLMALRTLGMRPVLALAIAAVFVLLPHYSTDRMWLAAFQIPLSVAFYFLALWAGAKATAPGRFGWKAAALAFTAASLLLYEVMLPFFAAQTVLLVILQRRHAKARGARLVWPRALGWQGVNLALVAALVIYKQAQTDRVGDAGALWRYRKIAVTAFDPRYDEGSQGFNLWAALRVNFGDWGLMAPRAVFRALTHDAGVSAIVAGVAIGALVFLRVRRGPDLAGTRGGVAMAVAGLGLFFLGYGVFALTDLVQFSAAGMINRLAIAPAFGIAVLICGLACALAGAAPAKARAGVLASILGVVCGASTVLIGEIGAQWDEASQRQTEVLGQIRRDVGTIGANHGVLMLDGVCPYVGPAPVFESQWDFSGALSVQNRIWPIAADIVDTGTKFEAGQISGEWFSFPARYPYAADAAIYDAVRNRLAPLDSAAAAQAYLAATPRPNCPPSRPGFGVRLF